jgi:hypothetical protein
MAKRQKVFVKCMCYSEQHALECSGIDIFLMDNFPDSMEDENSNLNLMDRALNYVVNTGNDCEQLKLLAKVVDEIRMSCLVWKRNATGVLVGPSHPDYLDNEVLSD